MWLPVKLATSHHLSSTPGHIHHTITTEHNNMLPVYLIISTRPPDLSCLYWLKILDQSAHCTLLAQHQNHQSTLTCNLSLVQQWYHLSQIISSQYNHHKSCYNTKDKPVENTTSASTEFHLILTYDRQPWSSHSVTHRYLPCAEPISSKASCNLMSNSQTTTTSLQSK